MAEKTETCHFEKGQTVDKPKEIVAMRTLLIDPTDPHSLDSGKYWLGDHTYTGQAWPTLHTGNLTLDPTETNPEQDIANNREHHCQIRLEGELAHSYHRNGKYIGTLIKETLGRLHERYTQAVGTAHNQTPHQSTLRTKLWEDHRIRVSTFEEEVGHLLIRYSSKEEKEERKKNLQNHWTFPAQMQRALQQAFGISTELVASPLNVHHNTPTYYAKYDRDKMFGARGSAWTTNWMKLGAYRFNPEYTPQDLKKTLDFAIAATTTQDPTHGSKREIETEEGGKEWASGAAVWDPRTGEGEAHMIRWEGHTVSLLKVKAHTGITGNERADEAAKQACTTGTLTEAWGNGETIKVKPMVPDGDSDSRELKGKLAVQKYVTTLLREGQAQGENRLSTKMAELQGEPTTWTHQPKKSMSSAGRHTTTKLHRRKKSKQ
ncbi:hypothetical protein CYMTET_12821 [Cymbomonas tetramitiformis]|uniref:PCIF1 WW domain-containing protein n=1 Tax=Cymbomonas tetramitiformis TaxID=36881 RepID=A0AAE0GJT6_9CHLO|nr:hypothetical protein CYMTET_12821 [Cymbomonas tetramitiformis]